MKTVQSCLLAAALLLTAAAPLMAQRGEQRATSRVQRNPIEIILDNRAELELTDDQVSQLTAINERLAEANGDVIEEIRKVRGQTRPASRQDVEQLMEKTQPLLDKIEENNRKALEEAEAFLTDEQKAKARELVQRERDRIREQMRPRVIRRGW
jgi:hypothetical protein